MSGRRWLTAAGVGCALVLFAARRTDQLTDPQIWDEEAAILRDLLAGDLGTFLRPINGYLVTVPKLLSLLALRLGGLLHYPAVCTALALLFAAGVFAWLSTAPLVNRGGPLLALAVALVPSDPEVLVVPLYTLWLAGLALCSLVLWRPDDASRLPARIGVAVVCGLSNPIVILLAPIALVRAVVLRRRQEWAVALAFAATAGWQLFMFRGELATLRGLPPLADLARIASRFLAYPLLLGVTVRPVEPRILYLVALAHSVAILAALWRDGPKRSSLALLGLFALCVGSSIARCDAPAILHPALAGPRYFFFPFVFLSWFWIDMALSAPWYVPRLAAGAAALLFVLSAGRHFNRRHRHLDWAGAVRELDATGHAVLPVHFDGSVELQWALKLQRCGERYCQVP